MRVKIEKSCRYANPGGPHLPQIDFIAGMEVDVSEELGADLVSNKHGYALDADVPETPVIEPESKEEGVVVESKEETAETEVPIKRGRGRPRKVVVDETSTTSE